MFPSQKWAKQEKQQRRQYDRNKQSRKKKALRIRLTRSFDACAPKNSRHSSSSPTTVLLFHSPTVQGHHPGHFPFLFRLQIVAITPVERLVSQTGTKAAKSGAIAEAKAVHQMAEPKCVTNIWLQLRFRCTKKKKFTYFVVRIFSWHIIFLGEISKKFTSILCVYFFTIFLFGIVHNCC